MATGNTVYALNRLKDSEPFVLAETAMTLTSEYRMTEGNLHKPVPGLADVQLCSGLVVKCPVLIQTLGEYSSYWLTEEGLTILDAAEITGE
jgi:hypothetical protein